MTCEEAIRFYKVLHSRIKSTGGEDWFIKVSDKTHPRVEVEDVFKEFDESDNKRLVNGYRYYFRPKYCSEVGPIDPNNWSVSDAETATY
jgi:hypothetical protein